MKGILIAIIIAALLIGGALAVSPDADNKEGVNNVVMDGDKQIINIEARGGYFPRVTTAKANLPTVIKVSTNNTFDCSSALIIPSLNFRKNLPPVGVTEIEVSPQQAGTKIQGLCSMGMYRFDINFI